MYILIMENNVAETIMQQIGHRAFVMMGTESIVMGPDSLTFSVGRNAKNVSKVRVFYDCGSDTYTVGFFGRTGVEKACDSDVTADVLHRVIESRTGLYLSL